MWPQTSCRSRWALIALLSSPFLLLSDFSSPRGALLYDCHIPMHLAIRWDTRHQALRASLCLHLLSLGNIWRAEAENSPRLAGWQPTLVKAR